MRIALVAPLYQTVPPRGYGGTERVLAFLIDEYIRLGHTVTLYSVGGSATPANLNLITTIPGTIHEIGVKFKFNDSQPEETNIEPYFTAQLCAVLSRISDYDVIHIHHETYQLHGTFFDNLPNDVRQLPIIWTDHVNLHIGDKWRVFEKLARADVKLTTLSNSHHELEPRVPWIATVYNGLPEHLLNPNHSKPSYIAFLGRLTPHKGAPAAIRIAAAAGESLKMAGPMSIDHVEYAADLRREIARNNVDYIGEIGDAEKSAFLSGARALLFPIQWDEPFGLVMIEAMACGTPVIAFRRGSVPEVLEDGVTGFIVDTEAEAAEKLKVVGSLDRARIRRVFEERFTARRMAEGYLAVYERICEEARLKSGAVAGAVDVGSMRVVVEAAERATVMMGEKGKATVFA